jgi:hypothetical protein
MMDPRRWYGVALVCVACGGRSEGEESTGLDRCGAAVSCGGDLAGTWSVESYCVDAEGFSGPSGAGNVPECDAVLRQAIDTMRVTPLDTRISFDGATYQFSGTASMAYRFDYTASCFRALGGAPLDASRCAELSRYYETHSEYDGSCSYAGTICRCNISSVSVMDATGPYQTSSGEILVDGEPTGGPYCVEGGAATVEMVSQGAVLRMQLRR